MAEKLAVYVKSILLAFAWLGGFHKQLGSKNVLGQLTQNKGNSFSLNGVRYDGVSWQAKKEAMDAKRKEKNQQALDWPDTLQALSTADTQLGHLFVGYLIAMTVSKFSWRDIFSTMLLDRAFPNKDAWDAWASDKKFSVLFEEDKEHVIAYVPTWEMLKEISQVCSQLSAIRGYSSIDNVSAREQFDTSLFDV